MDSFLNAEWEYKNPDPILINSISEKLKISNLIARILVNRGFNTINDIEHIFNSKLKNTIPESSKFLDIDIAVKRVAKAILNKENIIVFGDYDVDGITATCLLMKIFKYYGLNSRYYIPNRLKDGYGLSSDFIEKCIPEKIQLIIVVDSGIGAFEEVNIANKHNIDVVIFDHHTQLIDKVPEAVAVVNPNRITQKEINHSYIKSLCAAGVVFVFLVYLMQYFRKIARSDLYINLMDIVNLAALGTIGDLVALVGINRALVKYLLYSQKFSIGIKELMKVLNINNIKSIEEIAYYISPALNAAGRMGQADTAVELLLSDSAKEAKLRASELVILNTKRKNIEKQILREALNFAEKNENKKVVYVYGDNWHEGVIGIVSGKLRDKYQKPVFVIAFNDNELGRGSARSIPGLHIGQLINKAVEQGIIETGGGHELAGGLSIRKKNIELFYYFLEKEIPDKLVSTIPVDYVLTPVSNLKEILDEINKLAPYGTGLPKPVFIINRCRIIDIIFTSNNLHLRFILSDECYKGRLKAILFHSYMNKQFEQMIFAHRQALFDVLGSISYNENYGVSFIIKDIRFS